MYYGIYIKKTDPFTQAWSMHTQGWLTFKQVLEIATAIEKRVNHPPHAIKVIASETQDGFGKCGGGKVVLKWSRIEERSVKVADEIKQLKKRQAELAKELENKSYDTQVL